jgi:hypothetical protein
MNIKLGVSESLANQQITIRTDSEKARELNSKGSNPPPQVKPKPGVLAILNMKPSPWAKEVLNLKDALPELRTTLAPIVEQGNGMWIFSSKDLIPERVMIIRVKNPPDPFKH